MINLCTQMIEYLFLGIYVGYVGFCLLQYLRELYPCNTRARWSARLRGCIVTYHY